MSAATTIPLEEYLAHSPARSIILEPPLAVVEILSPDEGDALLVPDRVFFFCDCGPVRVDFNEVFADPDRN